MPTLTADISVRSSGADEDCARCADRLSSGLAGHRGLVDVSVVDAATLRVSYDPDLCSVSCVNHAADELGAVLDRRFHHVVLPVNGMDCYDCAQTIERAIMRLDGVSACSVNFLAASMRLEYEGDDAVIGAVERRVAALGYRLVLPSPNDADRRHGGHGAGPDQRAAGHDHDDDHDDHDDHSGHGHGAAGAHGDQIRVAASAALLVGAMLTSWLVGGPLATAMFAASIVIGGYSIARSGTVAVWVTRRPDINLLMTVAVIGAMAIGEWLEAALVVVLFSVGEALEHQAIERARRSLSDLLSLAPPTAHVRRDGVESEIAATDLVVDDIVVVRPGERLPGDGLIIDGAGAVDQAPITGESVPVDKVVGDDVFAGTLNGEGALTVVITRAPGDTTLDRISKAINEAQTQKAPLERWVDSFARIYTPAVLAVAALVMIVPPLVGAGSFSEWFYRGLAFLILACPCALVIATPVAIVTALGRASAAGILVKGGAHLERAADLQVIAFDKTGTLTRGEPRVVKVVAFAGASEHQVVRLAASLEAWSEHPLAGAVRDEARAANIDFAPVANFSALRGIGVAGEIDGVRYRVGKAEMFSSASATCDLPGPSPDRAASDEVPAATQPADRGESFDAVVVLMHREGRTVVAVGNDDGVLGVLAIADRPRPEARSVIDTLRAIGIEQSVMLTGDNRAAAEAIGHESGVTVVRAELMPDDKIEAIDDLERTVGHTAMVGDGVNDAPALARSSLGIAMGFGGSPTAIETADVALMSDDLMKIPQLIVLARWTRNVVRQNITISLVVKAVAAVFALTGVLTLWMAVLADVGATLLVVANGLRLRHGGPELLRGLDGDAPRPEPAPGPAVPQPGPASETRVPT